MNYMNKQSENFFEGWSHQNDINREQLILVDILKRKTTLGALPRLKDFKLQKSSDPQTKSQFKLEPVRINHLFNRQYHKRRIRQKAEGFKQFYSDSISPLKKKLLEILNEEQQQSKNTPETIFQQSGQQNRNQLINHKDQHIQQPKLNLNQNWKQKKFKAIQTLQKIKTKQLFGSRMKQTQSKMYMKLSALQMLEDAKSNIFRQTISIQNLASQDRFIFQNKQKLTTQSYQEFILKKHQTQQKQEKVNQKLKQTFYKFDFFDKDKSKKKQNKQKLDLMTEFTDRIRLTNSSLKLSKKSHIKVISPLKTIQKSDTRHQNLSSSIKVHKKPPHYYKLTIN